MKDFIEVNVKTVENGWEIYPGTWQQGSCRPEPYVFESWETLTDWLGENLSEPINS